MLIKKILNNNVVITINDDHEEIIVMVVYSGIHKEVASHYPWFFTLNYYNLL